MKKVLSVLVVLLLSMAILPMSKSTQAVSESEDTIIIYGASLTDEQKEQVRKSLNITDRDAIREYIVTGEDYARYIDGNPSSNMFSSAKIEIQEPNKGLSIHIVTPENITQVTSDMYANALLTAGVDSATVEIASPVQVTGHSALTGIYKAYDEDGEELDKDRMELANEELNVATDLADKEGLSQEKVSELLTEIKKEIADQKPATKEDVERIVKEQLDNLKIELNDADREMLINLFEKMRDLNIDFSKVKKELEDIASTIQDKLDDLGLDAGFWEKVANFFKELFQAIGNFFKGLFD